MQGNLLLPIVISLTKEAPFPYKKGLAQPTGPLPAARRAALIFEKIPAAIGQDADVPAAANVTPAASVELGLLTKSLSAANARSGIPLLFVSYPGSGIWPDASLAFM